MALEVDWGSANHYGPYDFAMADSAVCLFGLCVDWKKAFSGRSSAAGNVFGMAVMLHLFMSGEHTAGLTFLSITPWVGKGVLATVLIPSLFYWILRTAEKEQTADFLLLGLTCLAGCLLSSMGIMLTPVFVGTAMLLAGIRKKSISYVVKGAIACIPCVILGIYYIVLTH